MKKSKILKTAQGRDIELTLDFRGKTLWVGIFIEVDQTCFTRPTPGGRGYGYVSWDGSEFEDYLKSTDIEWERVRRRSPYQALHLSTTLVDFHELNLLESILTSESCSAVVELVVERVGEKVYECEKGYRDYLEEQNTISKNMCEFERLTQGWN